jgi:UDP-N-acetylmuramate dehydrogenase
MSSLLNLDGLQQSVLLAPYTTYKIGGPADYFVEAATVEQLVTAVNATRQAKVPYFILGTGANILIQDGGFRGLVIHNKSHRVSIAESRVTADSGVVMAELIEQTAQAGLTGLEHFSGIPSSVGGAMRQNLHFLAPDRQSTLFIAEAVESAEILTAEGQRQKVDRDYFEFGYDDSILHHTADMVLSVTFQLQPSPEATIRQQIQQNLAWRAAKQPPLSEFPSCGSVFKKIERVGAGRLIDQAGLKGHQIGGAQISAKHANFIVNAGGATSADVLALVKLVQDSVFEASGYRLEMEIGVIGEPVAAGRT